MRTFICALLFVPLIALAFPAEHSQTIKVPDGTALRLGLAETLSSATNEVDNPVHFEVLEDVKVGGIVVIPKGSTAVGHVVEAEPRKRMGRAGKLNFTVDHVKAPDDSNLRLRASSTRKGEDKTGTVIVGTVLLSPLFLIMRGKDVIIPKGTEIPAYVDGDREITLPSQGGTSPSAFTGSSQGTSVIFKSDPDGADISVDGKFVGTTPSAVQMIPGDHAIVIEKPHFTRWVRTMSVAAGSSANVTAVLSKAE